MATLRPARLVHLASCLVLAGMSLPSTLLANEVNVPPGYTGAPGEQSCAQCHISIPNTRNGRLNVDFGTLLSYTPGVRQLVTVEITPAISSYTGTGFQASARLSNNTKAGTLEAGPARTGVQVFNGQEYVNQTQMSPDRTYSFYWTPPATDVGEIKFYFSAVAGPRDFSANAIDEVYNQVLTLRSASATVPSGYRWNTLQVPGATTSAATAVSNDGRVAGTYVTGSETRGFLRNADGTYVTFQVPGATNTYPTGVNSSGVVVGSYTIASGARKGFIRRADQTYGTFEVPNTDTTLVSINDTGELIGTTGSSSAPQGVRVSANLQVSSVLARVPSSMNGNGAFAGVVPGHTSGSTTPPQGFIETREGYRQTFTTSCQPADSLRSLLGINDAGDFAGTCSGVQSTGEQVVTPFVRVSDSRNVRLVGPQRFYINAINNQQQLAGNTETSALLLDKCTATIGQNAFTVTAAGGSFSVNVTSESACNWTVASDSDWLLPVQAGGAGNSTLAVNAALNTGPNVRVGRLIVGGNTVTVTQEGTPCSYILSNYTHLLDAPGGSGLFNVNTTFGCTWTATPSVNWITITGGSPGNGFGTISFVVSQNPGTSLRSGSIFIGNQVFTINQAGSTFCTYQVTTSSSAYPASGGNGVVSVVTGDQCSWVSSSGASWLTIDTTVRFGSGNVTFSLAPNAGAGERYGTVAVAGTSLGIVQQGTLSPVTGLRFVPVVPCRVADTRTTSGKVGLFGPPQLGAGATREIPVPSSTCGIPANARAYSVNITVVPVGPLSYLTAWPTGVAQPLVSTLNSFNGRIVANAAVVPAGTNGSMNLFVTDPTDVIVDINGYFVPLDTPQALAFYPVTPCRVADTRNDGGKTGEFGPPALLAGGVRTMTIPASGCGIPISAQAYSLNVTAVPPGPLSFVTIWPAGQAQPVVSTLNSFDGQVVPNAAIVPAGTNGAINVFASDATNVVVDINGYFGPPGGTGGLNFYTLNPCRVADTRVGSGKTGAFGAPQLLELTQRDFPLSQAGCNVPASAQAFSVNLTAVPPGFLAYVTAWPTGVTRPFVSTLNSWNGQVVANAALVPAGLFGNISVFVSNTTDILMDINGYFAQ